MNTIPYEYILNWKVDNDNKLVVMLKYSVFKELKKDHPDIKHVYRTFNYQRPDTMLDERKQYEEMNPLFEEVSDELALWLALSAETYLT